MGPRIYSYEWSVDSGLVEEPNVKRPRIVFVIVKCIMPNYGNLAWSNARREIFGNPQGSPSAL
jgi:hypothetical protein